MAPRRRRCPKGRLRNRYTTNDFVIPYRKQAMLVVRWTTWIPGYWGEAAAKKKTPTKNPASDGTTYMSDHLRHIEQQPQGRTGPLDTTTGGAPAESPQGQSPPGMQAAPEG